MTFRGISLLTLAAGVLTLTGALTLLGDAPGVSPESGHLRRMKERDTAPGVVTPITLEQVLALPHGAPMPQRAEIERRGVSIEGWNQRFLLAGDGDLHLEMTAAPRTPESFDTAYVTCEITPRWRLGRVGWSYDRLLEVFRPNRGGNTAWDGGPRRVRVTGWLLYDYQYDARVSDWSLAHGSTRVSGWEVHPVTRIEAWDETLASWVEVPR